MARTGLLSSAWCSVPARLGLLLVALVGTQPAPMHRDWFNWMLWHASDACAVPQIAFGIVDIEVIIPRFSMSRGSDSP
jgi:hypothetical protein